jgi:hypothetical protein
LGLVDKGLEVTAPGALDPQGRPLVVLGRSSLSTGSNRIKGKMARPTKERVRKDGSLDRGPPPNK